MSGQWEKYVEKAAVSIDAAAFVVADPLYSGPVREFRRERARQLARVALTAVAPLIAEDTRTRMVEAAAAAVKREGAGSEREKVAEEVIARLVARRSEITPGRPGWVYFTEAIDMVNEVCGVEREANPTPEKPKVTWSDLFGIDPDFTGKACSVDYVRWQRGADTPVEFEHEDCWAFLLNDGKPLS